MNKAHSSSVAIARRMGAIGLMAVMFWMLALAPGSAAAQARSVRVGIYQNAPKIFLDQNGHPSGIFVDLLNAIAAQAGWKITYVPCQWADCLQELANGQIDLMPDVAYSAQRDEIFDFHQTPVLESWSVVYANPHDTINNISQLNGKTVAVLKDSIQQTDFGNMMAGYGFKTQLVPADSQDQVFSLASKGTVDAAIVNVFFGDYSYQKYGLVKTTIVFDPTTLYYATAQGKNHDLLDAIDRQMAAWLNQPGSTYYRVLQKWGAQQPASRIPQELLGVIGVVLGLFVVAAGVVILLRIQVAARTRKLQQANAELQESQTQFQALAQTSPVGIFRTDPQGATTYVNPQWCLISGMPAEKALGDGWLEAVHPEDREKVHKGWQAATVEHTPSFTDYRFIRPDGSVAWVMGRAVPEVDPHGQTIGYIGTVTDITDRKAVEAALQDRERQLSLIYANMADVLFNLAVEPGECFRFLSVNPAFLDVTGLREEQVVGKTVQEVIPEPSLSVVLENYKKAIRTKKTVSWEEISEYPAGRKYGQVSAIPIFDADGTCSHLIGTVHDITASKQAEIRILHINRLYATLSQLNQVIVEAANQPALFRAICRVAVENGQFRLAWIGLIDQTVQRVVPVDFAGDEQGYLTKLSITFQDEESGRGPTGTAIREGRCALCQDIAADPNMAPWRSVALQCGFRSSAAVPIRQAGQVIGAFTVYSGEAHIFDSEEEALLVKIGQTISYALDGLINESQRKLAEADLKQLNADLEQRIQQRTAQLEAANKELESFSYSVSHDLRAPLRAISGFSEIIARRYRADLNEEGQHYFDNIVQASRNMGRLIDDLLTYSRLGRNGVRHEPVPLARVVEEIRRNMQAQFSEAHGTLSIPADLPVVSGDQTLLSQIFTNLLENAFKYHQPELPPQVSLSYEIQGGQAIIKVSDNGIGIPPEYHEKIFNMFQRLHSEQEYPGTGIGLATVRKSVELLGGRVWVESRPGEGSTFFVRLNKEADKNE